MDIKQFNIKLIFGSEATFYQKYECQICVDCDKELYFIFGGRIKIDNINQFKPAVCKGGIVCKHCDDKYILKLLLNNRI